LRNFIDNLAVFVHQFVSVRCQSITQDFYRGINNDKSSNSKSTEKSENDMENESGSDEDNDDDGANNDNTPTAAKAKRKRKPKKKKKAAAADVGTVANELGACCHHMRRTVLFL
jgi:hypothetical protein